MQNIQNRLITNYLFKFEHQTYQQIARGLENREGNKRFDFRFENGKTIEFKCPIFDKNGIRTFEKGQIPTGYNIPGSIDKLVIIPVNGKSFSSLDIEMTKADKVVIRSEIDSIIESNKSKSRDDLKRMIESFAITEDLFSLIMLQKNIPKNSKTYEKVKYMKQEEFIEQYCSSVNISKLEDVIEAKLMSPGIMGDSIKNTEGGVETPVNCGIFIDAFGKDKNYDIKRPSQLTFMPMHLISEKVTSEDIRNSGFEEFYRLKLIEEICDSEIKMLNTLKKLIAFHRSETKSKEPNSIVEIAAQQIKSILKEIESKGFKIHVDKRLELVVKLKSSNADKMGISVNRKRKNRERDIRNKIMSDVELNELDMRYVKSNEREVQRKNLGIRDTFTTLNKEFNSINIEDIKKGTEFLNVELGKDFYPINKSFQKVGEKLHIEYKDFIAECRENQVFNIMTQNIKFLNSLVMGSRECESRSKVDFARSILCPHTNIITFGTSHPTQDMSGSFVSFGKYKNKDLECIPAWCGRLHKARLNETYSVVWSSPFRYNRSMVERSWDYYFGSIATAMEIKSKGGNIHTKNEYWSMFLNPVRGLKRMLDILYLTYKNTYFEASLGKQVIEEKLEFPWISDLRVSGLIYNLKTRYKQFYQKVIKTCETTSNSWMEGLEDPIFECKTENLDVLNNLTYLKQIFPAPDGINIKDLMLKNLKKELKLEKHIFTSPFRKSTLNEENKSNLEFQSMSVDSFMSKAYKGGDWEPYTYHPDSCYNYMLKFAENAVSDNKTGTLYDVLSEDLLKDPMLNQKKNTATFYSTKRYNDITEKLEEARLKRKSEWVEKQEEYLDRIEEYRDKPYNSTKRHALEVEKQNLENATRRKEVIKGLLVDMKGKLEELDENFKNMLNKKDVTTNKQTYNIMNLERGMMSIKTTTAILMDEMLKTGDPGESSKTVADFLLDSIKLKHVHVVPNPKIQKDFDKRIFFIQLFENRNLNKFWDSCFRKILGQNEYDIILLSGMERNLKIQNDFDKLQLTLGMIMTTEDETRYGDAYSVETMIIAIKAAYDAKFLNEDVANLLFHAADCVRNRVVYLDAGTESLIREYKSLKSTEERISRFGLKQYTMITEIILLIDENHLKTKVDKREDESLKTGFNRWNKFYREYGGVLGVFNVVWSIFSVCIKESVKDCLNYLTYDVIFKASTHSDDSMSACNKRVPKLQRIKENPKICSKMVAELERVKRETSNPDWRLVSVSYKGGTRVELFDGIQTMRTAFLDTCIEEDLTRLFLVFNFTNARLFSQRPSDAKCSYGYLAEMIQQMHFANRNIQVPLTRFTSVCGINTPGRSYGQDLISGLGCLLDFLNHGGSDEVAWSMMILNNISTQLRYNFDVKLNCNVLPEHGGVFLDLPSLIRKEGLDSNKNRLLAISNFDERLQTYLEISLNSKYIWNQIEVDSDLPSAFKQFTIRWSSDKLAKQAFSRMQSIFNYKFSKEGLNLEKFVGMLQNFEPILNKGMFAGETFKVFKSYSKNDFISEFKKVQINSQLSQKKGMQERIIRNPFSNQITELLSIGSDIVYKDIRKIVFSLVDLVLSGTVDISRYRMKSILNLMKENCSNEITSRSESTAVLMDKPEGNSGLFKYTKLKDINLSIFSEGEITDQLIKILMDAISQNKDDTNSYNALRSLGIVNYFNRKTQNNDILESYLRDIIETLGIKNVRNLALKWDIIQSFFSKGLRTFYCKIPSMREDNTYNSLYLSNPAYAIEFKYGLVNTIENVHKSRIFSLNLRTTEIFCCANIARDWLIMSYLLTKEDFAVRENARKGIVSRVKMENGVELGSACGYVINRDIESSTVKKYNTANGTDFNKICHYDLISCTTCSDSNIIGIRSEIKKIKPESRVSINNVSTMIKIGELVEAMENWDVTKSYNLKRACNCLIACIMDDESNESFCGTSIWKWETGTVKQVFTIFIEGTGEISIDPEGNFYLFRFLNLERLSDLRYIKILNIMMAACNLFTPFRGNLRRLSPEDNWRKRLCKQTIPLDQLIESATTSTGYSSELEDAYMGEDLEEDYYESEESTEHIEIDTFVFKFMGFEEKINMLIPGFVAPDGLQVECYFKNNEDLKYESEILRSPYIVIQKHQRGDVTDESSEYIIAPDFKLNLSFSVDLSFLLDNKLITNTNDKISDEYNIFYLQGKFYTRDQINSIFQILVSLDLVDSELMRYNSNTCIRYAGLNNYFRNNEIDFGELVLNLGNQGLIQINSTKNEIRRSRETDTQLEIIKRLSGNIKFKCLYQIDSSNNGFLNKNLVLNILKMSKCYTETVEILENDFCKDFRGSNRLFYNDMGRFVSFDAKLTIMMNDFTNPIISLCYCG